MMPLYACAVVSAPDGRILCQLRDDKPGVICAGLWSCCPGGHMDEGESPDVAVLRELSEEFEIEVDNVRFLMVHEEQTGECTGIYHAYYADLLTPLAEVQCNEGQRAEFFEPEQALDLPQHPVSRYFLESFLNNGRRS